MFKNRVPTSQKTHKDTASPLQSFAGQCFREIITVHYKKYSKYIMGQDAERVNVKEGGTYRNHYALIC
jgi:hypothetical protein